MRRTSKTCYSINVLYFTTWPLQFINLLYENHFTAKSSNELQNAPRSHLEENRLISSFSAEGSLYSLTHQEFIPHLFSSKSLTNYILHLSHPTSHYIQYKYHPKKIIWIPIQSNFTLQSLPVERYTIRHSKWKMALERSSLILLALPWTAFIHPFISSKHLILVRDMVNPEPIPGTLGTRQEYTYFKFMKWVHVLNKALIPLSLMTGW